MVNYQVNQQNFSYFLTGNNISKSTNKNLLHDGCVHRLTNTSWSTKTS